MIVYVVSWNYAGNVGIDGIFAKRDDAEARVAEMDESEELSACLNYIREYRVQ